MLSKEALATARGAIRVELTIRQRAFPGTLRQLGVVLPMNHVRNTRWILIVHHAIKDEYKARASVVWKVLQRLIQAEQVPPSRDLAGLAKSELRQAFDSHCGDLAQIDDQARRQTRPTEWPDHFTLKEEALASTDSEIDIELISTRRAPSPMQSTTVNIINPIGVVQTGAGAIATVHQTFEASQREALQQALNQIRQGLDSEALPVGVKSEVLDVLRDADVEVKAVSPNLLRLRGSLVAIASTIQTLGSMAAAYQLLRAAAIHIGVRLP